MVSKESSSRAQSRDIGWKERVRQVLEKAHLLGAAIAVHGFLRHLRFFLVNAMSKMIRWPVVGGAIDALVVRMDNVHFTHLTEAEFLRVIRALQDSGIKFWVAGGWGIDALIGCETRRHGDIDIVLDSYQEHLAAFDAFARTLGYHHAFTRGGTIWFPDAAVYEDGRGFQFEVISMDWERLRSAALTVAGTAHAATATDAESLNDRLTAHGRIGDLAIPVLSLETQRIVHSGYKSRRVDTKDDALFELIELADEEPSRRIAKTTGSVSTKRRPKTLLLIPIFDFPDELWRLCKLYRNDLDFIPPHITLAYPFLALEEITASVVEQLTSLFGDLNPIEFKMGPLAWFGTDVVYLNPTPSEPFRTTIEALQREFPRFIPYEGAFDSIIPHVTLSEHGSYGDRRNLAQRADRFLPLSATATHVWMMSDERGEGRWDLSKVFRLSGQQ